MKEGGGGGLQRVNEFLLRRKKGRFRDLLEEAVCKRKR